MSRKTLDALKENWGFILMYFIFLGLLILLGYLMKDWMKINPVFA